MTESSARLLKAQTHLRKLAEVYVPNPEMFGKETEVWFEAMDRDEQAAYQLAQDCAA